MLYIHMETVLQQQKQHYVWWAFMIKLLKFPVTSEADQSGVFGGLQGQFWMTFKLISWTLCISINKQVKVWERHTDKNRE